MKYEYYLIDVPEENRWNKDAGNHEVLLRPEGYGSGWPDEDQEEANQVIEDAGYYMANNSENSHTLRCRKLKRYLVASEVRQVLNDLGFTEITGKL